MYILYICAYTRLKIKFILSYLFLYHSDTTKTSSSYFEIYNNKGKKKCKCLNLRKHVQRTIQYYIHVNGVISLYVAYMNCSNTEPCESAQRGDLHDINVDT